MMKEDLAIIFLHKSQVSKIGSLDLIQYDTGGYS